jgi:hypothetical protein
MQRSSSYEGCKVLLDMLAATSSKRLLSFSKIKDVILKKNVVVELSLAVT